MAATARAPASFEKARASPKSRRGATQHLFLPFIPFGAACFWRRAHRATCLPSLRQHLIPSTPVSIPRPCRCRLLSAVHTVAPLSGCDLFMSPIKQLSPCIVARHRRSEEDGRCFRSVVPRWREHLRYLSSRKGRMGGARGDLLCRCLIELQFVRTISPCHLHVSRILSTELIEIYCKG